MTTEWIEECMRFHGRVLVGKYAHWCYDWDELPIDETCEEFKCCNCYPDHEAELTPLDLVLPKIFPTT